MSRTRRLVIFDDNASLYEQMLRDALETDWDIERGPSSTDWLAEHIGDAEAAIGLKLPPELRMRAKQLRVLLFPGAGVIHQDPMELPEGCIHANVYEHETPIAEYVFLALLQLGTGIVETATAFREGEWLGNGRVGGTPHRELFGATLGLIGFGHIGQEVAKRAKAFGLSVQAIRNHPETRSGTTDNVRILGGPEALDRLLETSDFVVIACPLTPQTHMLMDRERLRHMRKNAILVNVSRAEIIEERALFEALQEQWFAAAALDVWYRYPVWAGERLHGSQYPFHELPNAFITPHSSAWTRPMIERRARKMAVNLDHFARGEPLERVVLTGSWRDPCNSAV
jgi:phosphoglycerate dehydrogenase-like enzyme